MAEIEVSHREIYDRLLAVESKVDRVEKNTEAVVSAFRDDHWDMLDLPQRFDAAILAHFDATRGSRYSWLDLIRSQIFNTGANEVGASFCSEWRAEALGLPNGTIFSPRTLGELIRVLLATPWAQPAATQSHT